MQPVIVNIDHISINGNNADELKQELQTALQSIIASALEPENIKEIAQKELLRALNDAHQLAAKS